VIVTDKVLINSQILALSATLPLSDYESCPSFALICGYVATETKRLKRLCDSLAQHRE
jgi:hypothetical protein